MHALKAHSSDNGATISDLINIKNDVSLKDRVKCLYIFIASLYTRSVDLSFFSTSSYVSRNISTPEAIIGPRNRVIVTKIGQKRLENVLHCSDSPVKSKIEICLVKWVYSFKTSNGRGANIIEIATAKKRHRICSFDDRGRRKTREGGTRYNSKTKVEAGIKAIKK